MRSSPVVTKLRSKPVIITVVPVVIGDSERAKYRSALVLWHDVIDYVTLFMMLPFFFPETFFVFPSRITWEVWLRRKVKRYFLSVACTLDWALKLHGEKWRQFAILQLAPRARNCHYALRLQASRQSSTYPGSPNSMPRNRTGSTDTRWK